MPFENFHPTVAAWFRGAFPAPTPAQERAWPAIRSGRHALIAAPTGSGKTLAAFLAAIDALVRDGVAGKLTDETRIVYVSPLKALSNDVRINLEAPLAGIRDKLFELGFPDVEIRTSVRTGDTPQSERAAMKRRPPHIVVTTPESLYILLGSESGRAMLASTRSVIVDEIHALAPSKRGAHLALSLERLEASCGRPLTRIGLSATQKPISEVAKFLLGGVCCADAMRTNASRTPRDNEAGSRMGDIPGTVCCIDSHCEIVDTGHTRDRDLAIEVPPSPLSAVMSADVWTLLYNRLAELIQSHRTTLVFVNTRRMAERVAKNLSDRLGKDAVTSHHGSLAREQRLAAEQRLKRGELRALVATASLELGIDIGDVDLVCQIASPRSIATFLQRAGRANHAVEGTPKARLFPTSRDDLIECAALLDAVRRGELDTLHVERDAFDVLAQQIVAEVACREWNEAELYALVTRAYPFAGLPRQAFTAIVRMLADGYSTRRGPRAAYIHRDAVNGVLRARRGARLTALTSGGAIPDTADYEVVLEPAATRVGTVHEDFAVESMADDIFQLGNTSYRILRVERGSVRVEDAQGMAPTLPFWLGEAPGRSDELSYAVSRLRETIAEKLEAGSAVAQTWLSDAIGLSESAAHQIVDYLGGAKAAFGMLPTQTELAMERFFDESGGTQLVIHAPFGSRINRAWGLALRKRFCRTFNFELQAAATEDAIILSLSTSHSFPLEDVTRFLHSNSVRHVLTQALLDAPMFGVRWRWNATTSLALPRFAGGAKVPPQLQRMKSEDLLAAVFPDQVACLENIVGERQIPDHPLVAQTVCDCLHAAMDIAGLEALLRRLESGEVRFVCRDLTAPSPLAAEVLSARPYAFLDDAPLEERRTQAVMSRRWGDIESTDDFGRLDPDAIATVREEAWPEAANADELHAALMGLGFLSQTDFAHDPAWQALLDTLIAQRRATRCADLHIATERLPQFRAIFTEAAFDPPVAAPAEFTERDWTREAALADIVRARLTGSGPVQASQLATMLHLPQMEIDVALLALEREGTVMQGHFTPGLDAIEWCDRHLLARIHRYTVRRLRREIEPVDPRDFMRFLFEWQHVAPATQVSGPDALAAVLAQLEGFEAPAAAWESEILPARVAGYEISWLDDLCTAGRVVWSRLRPRASAGSEHGSGPVRATPIVLLQRRSLAPWNSLRSSADDSMPASSSRAQTVADFLRNHGASFFDELLAGTHLLHIELEEALAELVAAGHINSDSFAGLRALLVPQSKRPSPSRRRGRRTALLGIADAGRWSLVRRTPPVAVETGSETVEHVARTLLRRYGVICWRLLAREADWLPPWRELLRVCQRLEARGEIRGGRFIAGLSGEQFALPEAIAPLRAVRQRAHAGALVAISGADPLNLVGSIVAGNTVPALTGSRILYRDGLPIATLVSGNFNALEAMDAAAEWKAKSFLLRSGEREPAPAIV
ncbi:MAG: DEAD/DEAH box helicase [Xanthomonadaceae bacterium]|nr:DEAD/DEAH box helicase [Xanthomonadaceae bacterium]MDE2084039.1 DEAD/DEAH box helicase [Xanthomonadaceae bacterium]